MARPARTKKVVDYSQCEDFDDDEDFACVSAPPSKKSRLTPKDQKQRKEKNIKNSGSQDAKVKKELTKERLPLDEKLYQRNLEAALVLSVQEPTSEGLDKISAETEGPSVRPRQRRAAAGAASKQKQILLDDKGSDGECEEDSAGEKEYLATEESESSESNTDEDEEFTFKNLSNKNKKRDKSKIQTKKEKKSPKPNDGARVVVPVKSKPLLLEIMPASPPPSKSLQVLSPSTGMRKPKWTPPAPKESSNNSQERTSVRSPCQGLRLGLSRLARVKPLHRSTDND
ncbi:RAD51-associated protein 1 isoform X1 [Carcharodon carcharias]|uniref:RAD51-associated protein 1 isoform X1 n=1 Tax=Carcharodon carcharias TaxID=13397 RepID=UPI001B7DB7C9|nr:RAD51-associated protein 1 isoform X1 [Carcharodon carcharias]